MSAPIDSKRVVCEFLVAAAACGAAYYFLAHSARAKVVKAREAIAKVQRQEASAGGIGALTDAQVRDLQRTTMQRADEIRARSGPAADEAAMFARVSELASANLVRIEQLNPISMPSSAAAPALPPGVGPGTPAAAQAGAVAPADAPAVIRDTRVAYTMSATGSFSAIAGFVGALQNQLGYTMIRNVRITQPDFQNPTLLRAAIETEQFAFDLAAVKIPPLAAAPATPAPAAPAHAAPAHASVPVTH